MAEALIAYVTWNRVVPWKILSLPIGKKDRFAPIGYGSNQPVFLQRAKKGTMLYVLSLPKAKGRRVPYPPTLVAKIRIKGLYTRDDCPDKYRSPGMVSLLKDWCCVAVSEPAKSEFYDLNDVSEPLRKLGLVSSVGKGGKRGASGAGNVNGKGSLSEDERLALGKGMQSIRIVKGGAKKAEVAFRDFVRGVKGRRVFISYTHKADDSGLGGEYFAQELARGLLGREFSVWLDALTIPRYDFRKSKREARRRLKRLIEIGIDQSDLAICVVSANYVDKLGRSEMTWIRTEYERIVQREEKDRKFAYAIAAPRGRQLGRPLKMFSQTNPKRLARAISNWWPRGKK